MINCYRNNNEIESIFLGDKAVETKWTARPNIGRSPKRYLHTNNSGWYKNVEITAELAKLSARSRDREINSWEQ